jgi:hypothetical protein
MFMSAISRLTQLAAGAAAATALSAALSAAAWAQELSLKRVMLSSGGVGYFEYESQVDGDAQLRLTVPLDQVDDVLKSLVVYDDKGSVGTISLPGSEPLAYTLKDLPFGQDALASPAALLNALRGAEISVGGARAISGRVVSVTEETVTSPDGKTLGERHRVTVFTDKGLQSFILQEAESLQFADASLRQQVGQALSAIQANRAKEARTFDITARGQGRRAVRVAYIVAVPLWKGSYRLTLPADPTAARAALQGWATIENLSGQDWKDVELTLVSGSPVTFKQALYQAYFVERPQVPVEVVGRLLPTLDRGGVGGQMVGQGGRTQVPPAAPRSRQYDDLRQQRAGVAAEAAPAPPPPMPGSVMAKVADPVEESEALTQITYRFPRPVTVANGRTLSLPIIDREAPAQRLALYQPETHQRHPLASVRLGNDGETGLPPGVITLYERGTNGQTTYVGDARLSALPAGENRLLSYALDQKIVIEREQAQTQRLTTGVITQGALRYGTLNRQTVTYRVKGPAKEPRALIIEQPRNSGWKLVKPEGSVEISEGRYRLPFRLPGGAETQVFEVVQEQVVQQTVQLLQAGRDTLRVFANANEFDARTREQLGRVIALYADVDAAEAKLKEIDAERNRIVQDQQRVRENLARVPSNSDLQRRYLATLDRQETEIEELGKKRLDAERVVAQARAAVEAYVRQIG